MGTVAEVVVPLPKLTRMGEVRNPTHPPVPAREHLLNRPTGLMWPAHVQEVQDRLTERGITRTDTEVDNAIQSAREALHTDRDAWPTPDTAKGWWDIQPLMAGSLDLDIEDVEATP